MRPKSNLRRGNFQSPETAFAHKLFPQPCTPSNKTPLGAGSPNFAARSEKAIERLVSQSFRFVSPATSVNSSFVYEKSLIL